jgi:hypothetical protein
MPTAFRLRVGKSVAIADAAEWIEMGIGVATFLTSPSHCEAAPQHGSKSDSAAINALLREEFEALREPSRYQALGSRSVKVVPASVDELT